MKGGFNAVHFFLIMVNMVLYTAFVIKFDLLVSATTTTNYLGTTFILTLVGGFISDPYMTGLSISRVFFYIELMIIMFPLHSYYKNLKLEVHVTKAFLFCISICLVWPGGGGIRGTSKRKYTGNFLKRLLLLSITIGTTLSVTFVVYASTKVQWDIALSISLWCTFVGLIFVALGKPIHQVFIPGDSPLLRVLEVLVVSVKNRRKELPLNTDRLHEVRNRKWGPKEELIPHSVQFRFLNKAAIPPEGTYPQRWKVCTVTQVEEVKILARMMPILLSTILMNTCLAQLQTFSVRQGTLMASNISSFQVPAGSFTIIPFVFMSLLIPIYEIGFIPLIRRATSCPNGITHLQRVRVGLVLSAISMGIAGLMEVKRKHELLHHGRKISLFWLSFHYAIFGVADTFTLVGLMEFFYSEAPAKMKYLSTSFSWLSLSIGYSLSSAFVGLINGVSRHLGGGQKGWLEGRDMNANHMERFYWFLAVLNVASFVNYVVWANWYKYRNGDGAGDEEMLLRNGSRPDNGTGSFSTSLSSGSRP